ncbi:hypothetical protein V7266_14360 [Neobacillus drentensis]|uniref:hypothetical protein n=1 Tax=Neobacillus drentensis TaxID=220684 RepID=UPI0030005E59
MGKLRKSADKVLNLTVLIRKPAEMLGLLSAKMNSSLPIKTAADPNENRVGGIIIETGGNNRKTGGLN